MTYLECLRWMNSNTDLISETFMVNGIEVSIHYFGILVASEDFPRQYYFTSGDYFLVTSSRKNSNRSITLTNIEVPKVFEPDDVWFNFSVQHNIGREELVLYQQIRRYLKPYAK